MRTPGPAPPGQAGDGAAHARQWPWRVRGAAGRGSAAAVAPRPWRCCCRRCGWPWGSRVRGKAWEHLRWHRGAARPPPAWEPGGQGRVCLSVSQSVRGERIRVRGGCLCRVCLYRASRPWGGAFAPLSRAVSLGKGPAASFGCGWGRDTPALPGARRV